MPRTKSFRAKPLSFRAQSSGYPRQRVLHFTLFAALLALPSLASAQSRNTRVRVDDRDDRYRASLDTAVAFDARGTVSVSCPGGSVVVTASERNEVRVKARTENGAIRFSSNGTRATVESASGRGCSDGRFEVA